MIVFWDFGQVVPPVWVRSVGHKMLEMLVGVRAGGDCESSSKESRGGFFRSALPVICHYDCSRGTIIMTYRGIKPSNWDRLTHLGVLSRSLRGEMA